MSALTFTFTRLVLSMSVVRDPIVDILAGAVDPLSRFDGECGRSSIPDTNMFLAVTTVLLPFSLLSLA